MLNARRIIALFGALAIALPAGAQAPVSTGVSLNSGRDTRWDISVNGGASGDAWFITTPPSPPWQPNTGSYAWIGASASGTLPGGIAGGPTNFAYLFTLMFTVNDPSTAVLNFRCAVDNTLMQVLLNGVATGSSCAVFSFGAVQSLSGLAGVNTLSFSTKGDGVTDGLLVDLALSQSTVPEPATLLLFATGLLGLGGATFLRRKNRV